jgi:murein L,D-transpeptidase YafK
VTIGCIPITDEGIKELYIATVEAKNNGQSDIPVSIFPCRLEDSSLQSITRNYACNKDYCDLWTDMKKEYDYFKQFHRQSVITVMGNGRYYVE